jgi:predicted acyl esterase
MTDAKQKPVFSTTHAAGMDIDWDVPILMDDGLTLRADVYRPSSSGRYPVILSYGPYAKGLATQDGYPSPWANMVEQFPDALAGTSNSFQSWEVVDPEKWVPDGYVCVRVDSRGSGRSPGVVDPFSARETQDYFDSIEWAGVQEWSNGKVGLSGISYFAINQWQVAAMNPPHLAAMCPWEGASDFYRDGSYQGGIPSQFWKGWYGKQCNAVQHGLGERGYRSRVTGEWVSGDVTMTDEELTANRIDFGGAIAQHPVDDDFHRERSGRPEAIRVPILSAGNWGGQGLHLRGNTYGWERATTPQKWLEMHGGPHWAEFYTDYGVDLQKRFFGYFLKGENTGWDSQPPVLLQVRHIDGFTQRAENEWPIARTNWSRYYLDATRRSLSREVHSSAHREYRPGSDEITFATEPLRQSMEVTGPIAARLYVSSKTADADLFLTLRVHAPDGTEVVFQGALDPHTPIAQGWLRASHREIDTERSRSYRPYHSHATVEPLQPGQVYAVDIEILPTSLVIPAGYSVSLTVSGDDYVYPGDAASLSMISVVMTGCGPFIHPDRANDELGGPVTVYTGPDFPSHLVLPIIPDRDME